MSLTLQIRYQPHQGQSLFHESQARFRLLACGRRWGKTKGGANETIRQTTLSPENAVVFCVAPTYWHTQKQWEEVLLYLPKQLLVDVNRSEHKITLLGNRKIWFKSADNPDSLRSEGLDFLWVDEGGQIGEEAWNLALRPALMDKHGRAIFTGTPKGKNWYFQLWTRGQDPKQTDYKSWSFPSTNNPYLDPKEISEFARDMPELAYRQEIMGEFLDEIGSVFRRVKDHIKGNLEPPAQDKTYVAGVDFAKHVDFTVIYILDMHGHLCAYDRFGQLDWELQLKRVADLAQQYHARTLVDASGVGDPIYDRLRRMGLNVEGYKFTVASKAELIENLSIMLERNEVSYPAIPELIAELGLYGYTTTRGGTVQYGAPEGYHDDCVTALALAAWMNRTKFEPTVVNLDW